MDKYLVELGKVADSIERLCGMCERSNEGVLIRNLDIGDVAQACEDRCAELSNEMMKDLNATIGRKIVTLAYLGQRMQFYGKKKLNFSLYPCMPEVAQTLLFYTERKNLNSSVLDRLERFIVVLQAIDDRDSSQRNTLAYRYLRIFIVLIIYGCNCNAGIVANFILHQMVA